MSFSPGTPTLDQLQLFVEVVESGSFTAAAKRKNRAISAVSYAIGNLEAQLGVTLLDRQTARKLRLTEAGRVVLGEARSVVGGVGNLRAKVRGMLQGLEGELSVVLDSLLPPERVVDALTAFNAQFPTVALNLHVETLGAVAALVLQKTAAIGIGGRFALDRDELTRLSAGSFRMVPVAGRGHPLASPPATGHPPGVAREHVQLVVYDRSMLTQGQDFSVSANHSWRLADLSAKHMLLKGGIGWGMMPLAMVRDDIDDGLLVQLKIPDVDPFDYLLDAIYRNDTPPGPAATWMIERFRHQGTERP